MANKACMDFSITSNTQSSPQGTVRIMRWHFPTGKTAKPSVSGHLFEPLKQDAIRDEDLFHLEDARHNKRNPIALWTSSAEGFLNDSSDRLGIDAEKVVDQLIFRIGEIGSSTGNHPKGDLDFSHGGTSQAVQ